MLLAIVAAISLGFLLYEISYLAAYLIPDASNQVPTPTSTTSTIDALFGALLLVGLAVLIAFTIALVGLFINRVRKQSFFKFLSWDL